MKVKLSMLTKVKGSKLEKMFTTDYELLKKDDDGAVHLDVDMKSFLTMLEYLESDRKKIPTDLTDSWA